MLACHISLPRTRSNGFGNLHLIAVSALEPRVLDYYLVAAPEEHSS
jgi:hypothetical protein